MTHKSCILIPTMRPVTPCLNSIDPGCYTLATPKNTSVDRPSLDGVCSSLPGFPGWEFRARRLSLQSSTMLKHAFEVMGFRT